MESTAFAIPFLLGLLELLGGLGLDVAGTPLQLSLVFRLQCVGRSCGIGGAFQRFNNLGLELGRLFPEPFAFGLPARRGFPELTFGFLAGFFGLFEPVLVFATGIAR